MTKPMRLAMPATTAFIDDLRAAFGTDQISILGPDGAIEQITGMDQIKRTIRAGLDGQPVFWAKENGIEMGTQSTHNPERTVSLADIHLGPWNAASKPARRN